MSEVEPRLAVIKMDSAWCILIYRENTLKVTFKVVIPGLR